MKEIFSFSWKKFTCFLYLTILSATFFLLLFTSLFKLSNFSQPESGCEQFVYLAHICHWKAWVPSKIFFFPEVMTPLIIIGKETQAFLSLFSNEMRHLIFQSSSHQALRSSSGRAHINVPNVLDEQCCCASYP